MNKNNEGDALARGNSRAGADHPRRAGGGDHHSPEHEELIRQHVERVQAEMAELMRRGEDVG